MELVGSRFKQDVDLAACSSSKLSRVPSGEGLSLCHGFGCHNDQPDLTTCTVLCVVKTIKVPLRPFCSAKGELRRGEGARWNADNAGREQQVIEEIARSD